MPGQTHQTRDVQFEGIVTLTSSLSHIGETVGTDAVLRREKIIQPDGNVEEVFVYSGNAFRGQLRDCGMLYFVERLGLRGFNLETFYMLFSGGILTSTGGALDIDQVRAMRKLVPLMSVLGCAYGNQIMQGKLLCGKMYPLTQECKRQIPENYHDQLAKSWRLWLQEENYVRKDDAKNEHLKPLLEHSAQLLTTSADREAVQMRHTVETIAAGARFYHSMYLYGVNDVEYGAFLSALTKFSERPFLGGMSRAGLGQCIIEYNHCTIGPVIQLDEEAKSAKATYDEFLSQYEQYMLANAEEVQRVLGLPAPAGDGVSTQ